MSASPRRTLAGWAEQDHATLNALCGLWDELLSDDDSSDERFRETAEGVIGVVALARHVPPVQDALAALALAEALDDMERCARALIGDPGVALPPGVTAVSASATWGNAATAALRRFFARFGQLVDPESLR